MIGRFERRRLSLVVFLFALALLDSMPRLRAQTVIVSPRSFTLTTASPVLQSPTVALDPETESIAVRMRRPTTGNPLAWDSTATVKVSIVQVIDGREETSSSRFTGGIRVRRGGSEAPEMVKRISPTVYADKSGTRQPFMQDGRQMLQLTRQGERAQSYAVFVRFELVRGTSATVDLLGVEYSTAVAPTIPYHNSVALDSKNDGQDQSGDGTIDVTIDPISSSNLVAFAGGGNSGGTSGRNGSATYNGVAMAEKWDTIYQTNYANAGYVLAIGSDNASRVVNNTLAAAPDEHAFGVMVFEDGDQTTPAGTAVIQNGTGTAASATVTDARASGMVVDTFYGESAPTAGADQSQQNVENIASLTWMAQSTQDGAVSPAAMSWSLASDSWSVGAVALYPHVSVTLSGTITASTTETDVVNGGKTIILTASDDTFVDNTAAIVYVGGQDNSFAGTTSNTDITFALTNGTNSTPQIGDLVVVTFCTGSVVDRTLSITNTGGTAYTLIGSELYSNDTFDTNMRVAYRFMPDPVETAVRFAGGSGNAQDAATYAIQVFRNVDTGTPMDVAAQTVSAADQNTRLIDPPGITPSTAGAWIGISGCAAGGTLTADFTSPGGAAVSDFRTDSQSDTNDSGVAAWHNTTWTSGEYNPAALTGGGTDTTSDSYASVAWALRPATDSAFDNARDEIRDGCDSAQSEGSGWDALKTTTMPVANVARDSATQVTITLAPAGSYSITANETVTCIVPAVALVANAAVTASPTFTITNDGAGPPPCTPRMSLLGVSSCGDEKETQARRVLPFRIPVQVRRNRRRLRRAA